MEVTIPFIKPYPRSGYFPSSEGKTTKGQRKLNLLNAGFGSLSFGEGWGEVGTSEAEGLDKIKI
jgi:hypothetical protein